MKNNERIVFKGYESSRDEDGRDTSPVPIYVPVNDRSTEKYGY